MSGARTLLLAGVLLAVITVVALFIPSDWQGVDEAVLAPIAERAGRPAAPLMNIEGDLLLFLFTLAGAVGGIIIGYTWRTLFGGEEARQAAQGRADSSG